MQNISVCQKDKYILPFSLVTVILALPYCGEIYVAIRNENNKEKEAVMQFYFILSDKYNVHKMTRINQFLVCLLKIANFQRPSIDSNNPVTSGQFTIDHLFHIINLHSIISLPKNYRKCKNIFPLHKHAHHLLSLECANPHSYWTLPGYNWQRFLLFKI